MARSTRLDQATLSATLRVQHDVIARRQATACGMTGDALAHRLRPGGPWRRLLPSTYLAVTGTPTPAQKDMAAQLYAGPGSVLTGRAALPGLGITNSAPSVIDVLIPLSRERGSTAFVAVHQTTRMPGNVAVSGRRRYATAPRAIADTARWLADLREVRAVVLHFTPRETRSEPASVIAAIAGPVKAGSARPPLPVAVRRASA